MAFRYLCDGGCGADIGTPPVDVASIQSVVDVPDGQRGFVAPTRYCDACLPSVTEFEKERDRIHEEAAALFLEKLNAARESWHATHAGGRLPDERPA